MSSPENQVARDAHVLTVGWIEAAMRIPGIHVAARVIERKCRIDDVRKAVAWRALEIATDPETPQGQYYEAVELHEKSDLPLLGENELHNNPATPEDLTPTRQETLAPIAYGNLTRDQREFREMLLGGLSHSYTTYAIAIESINKKRKQDGITGEVTKLVEEDIIDWVETTLTPEVTVDLHKQFEYAVAHPIEYSPKPGFDILLIPNEDLTMNDEDALAAHVQNSLPTNRRQKVLKPIHNKPNQAAYPRDKSVRIVFAPRHLNLVKGDASEHRAAMACHNSSGGATMLKSGNDFESMVHDLHLIRTNPNDDDWANLNTRNVQRYWSTIHQNVGLDFVETIDNQESVPIVVISEFGQLFRASSPIRSRVASRALVVPKV